MRRAAVLSLHRWLALAFAPFLLIQALTGAVLVIHETMDTFKSQRQASAPVSRMVEGAIAALPGHRVTRLYVGTAPFAELSGPDGAAGYASVDPATGTTLSAGRLWRFPYRAIVQVHYRLASGGTGLVIVLTTGAVLAVLAISGAVFWWPGRTKALRALAVRRNLPARFRLRQWHRTVGVLAATLALFSAGTGLLLAGPDVLALTASPDATPAASAMPPVAPPVKPDQIDRAVALAQAQFPDAALRDIRFPAADRLDLNFAAPERNPRAVHVVSVRISDGTIVKTVPAAENPVLWMKVLSLHTGESFGLAGIVLLLGESGSLAFLVWAGLRMWLQARARKQKGI